MKLFLYNLFNTKIETVRRPVRINKTNDFDSECLRFDIDVKFKNGYTACRSYNVYFGDAWDAYERANRFYEKMTNRMNRQK